MSDARDKMKSVIDEEERKRLISEISRIKDILDSFKYGLNFEDFAEELFKTIDRQTRVIKKLDETMRDIIDRLERLEAEFKEGIKVFVTTRTDSGEGAVEEVVIGEKREQEETAEEAAARKTREELTAEAAELKARIAKLFEKENEYLEMVLNDPAGAEEHERKAEAARKMRREAEERLAEIESQLEE